MEEDQFADADEMQWWNIEQLDDEKHMHLDLVKDLLTGTSCEVKASVLGHSGLLISLSWCVTLCSDLYPWSLGLIPSPNTTGPVQGFGEQTFLLCYHISFFLVYIVSINVQFIFKWY